MFSDYKHIIWDWNGTLLNDVSLCVDIVNNILIKKNLTPLSIEAYRNIFTFPIRNYYEKAGFDFSQYTFEEVGLEWMGEYERRRPESLLHSGVTETLTLLKENEIGQSVLSAYPHRTLVEVITHFNLNDFFTHIMGHDNIYATSKVDLGKELMKKISNGNSKVLLIGDTEHDYEVAAEIGADCALIADGHQSKEKLLGCKASVYESISELTSELFNQTK